MASTIVQNLVSRLSREDLPVLAKTATEIAKQVLRGERASAQEISDIVLHDPFYTLNVLRAIGQRKRSRLSSEITTIEHAVMLFGAKPFFERFAKPIILEAELKTNPKALLQLRRALSRAHHAACQACDWAIFHQDMESEEVYIAAAINDIAEAYLCWVAPELAAQLTEDIRRDPGGTSAEQQALLGFDLHTLFEAISQMLNLPELMCHLTDPNAAQNVRVNTVQLGAAVARHAEFGWYGSALEADLAKVATLLNLQLGEAVGHVHRTAVLAARAWRWYEAPPAARWLALLPEPIQHEATSVPVIPSRPQAPPGPMQDLMQWAMQALQTEVGLRRVVFAMRTPDGQYLRAKLAVGASAPSTFSQFEVGLSDHNLFAHMLQKPQGVWLNQQNQANLQAYVNATLLHVIGRGEFFAHSLFLGAKPFGLFYGDCHDGSSGYQLDETRYIKFKEIVAKVSRGLQQLSTKST